MADRENALHADGLDVYQQGSAIVVQGTADVSKVVFQNREGVDGELGDDPIDLEGLGMLLDNFNIFRNGGDVVLENLGAGALVVQDADGSSIDVDAANTGGDVDASSISEGDLSDSAITTRKIQDSTVTSRKIGPSSITSGLVAPSALASGLLRPSGVPRGRLRHSAVDHGRLAASTVQFGDIQDSAVDAGKVGDSAIDNRQLAPSAVGSGILAPSSVDSGRVRDDAITQSEIGADAVGATELLANLKQGFGMVPLPVANLSHSSYDAVREHVSAGHTLRVFMAGVQNVSGSVPAGLRGDVVLASGAGASAVDPPASSVLVSATSKRQVGDAIASATGPVDVSFRTTNFVSAAQDANAVFRYVIE